MSAQDFPADKLDQALDPPEYPERSAPLTSAPFSALLRAADEWLAVPWGGEHKDHIVACEFVRLRNVIVASLHRLGCEDVDLTEAEWQAHAASQRETDPRI